MDEWLMRRLVVTFAALTIAASACSGASGSGTPAPGETRASAAPSASAACPLQMGVAGLIPPNYPTSSAADWTSMYESLDETGSLLGVYTNWSDSEPTAGQIPAVIDTAFGLSTRYAFTPFIALGFTHDVAGGGVESTVAWSDAVKRASAVAVSAAIARKYKPHFLALGVEVNRAFESNPAGFDAFVSAYGEMYDAIKAVSPATAVFPIFQLEMTKGNAYLMGGSEARQPEWSLLDRFAGKMDLAAFTTYPFLDATSPADLPADYYAEIATHTDKPIALTEIGWPSAPISSAPGSAYGGTPAEQSAFVTRLFQLTRDLNMAAELWAFPDDLGPDYPNAALTSVSLRDNHGAPKRALAVWRAKAQAPCATVP